MDNLSEALNGLLNPGMFADLEQACDFLKDIAHWDNAIATLSEGAQHLATLYPPLHNQIVPVLGHNICHGFKEIGPDARALQRIGFVLLGRVAGLLYIHALNNGEDAGITWLEQCIAAWSAAQGEPYVIPDLKRFKVEPASFLDASLVSGFKSLMSDRSLSLRTEAAQDWLAYVLQNGFKERCEGSNLWRHTLEQRRAPVLAYNASIGVVNWLHVERVGEAGRGAFYPHTVRMGLKSIQSDFMDAMENAWRLARPNITTKIDVRWWIDCSKETILRDQSIGAAACVVLHNLLNGGRPDDECAITAAVDEHGGLMHVEHVYEKTKAAFAYRDLNDNRVISQVVVIKKDKPAADRAAEEANLPKDRVVLTAATVEETLDLISLLTKLSNLLQPSDDALPGLTSASLAAAQDVPYPDIPFDLQIRWGLDRGAFLGVVAGPLEANLCEKLRQSEVLLNKVLKSADQESFSGRRDLEQRVPLRWWMQLDMSSVPSPPRDQALLWKNIIGLEPGVRNRLDKHGLPEWVAPGFVIVVEREKQPWFFMHVLQWYQALSRTLFPTRSVAVIVHIEATAQDERYRLVRQWGDRVCSVDKTIAIDAMVLVGYEEAFDLPVSPPPPAHIGEVNIFRSHSRTREPNPAALYRWVENACSAPEVLQSLERNFPELIEVLAAIEPRDHTNAYTAEQVASYIDSLALSDDSPIPVQLLELTQRYMPQRLPSLLEAFARSPEGKLIMASLHFAGRADDLIDLWLGAIDPGRMSQLLDEGTQDALDSAALKILVLGLLRRYQSGMDRPVITSVLAEMALPRPERTVCELCFGKISAEEFLETYGPDEYALALRVSYRFSLSARIKAALSLDRPDLWWLLGALPLVENDLTGVINMPPKGRAVWGLCTSHEYHELIQDRVLERKILACRRIAYRPE